MVRINLKRMHCIYGQEANLCLLHCLILMVALPVLCFMPFEGENSFAELDSIDKVKAFFETHFPQVNEQISNLTKDFFNNPTSALVTTKCFPWTYWDKVALVGDSAHAIVPFYGQGMNAGFEDITVLNELMDQYTDDWESIFKEYQNQRKPNADAIAELSYRNFIEMSTKTADVNFLLRKKIEKWFSEKHPDKWMPLYSRVTFSHRPYAEALEIGDFQKRIMDEVMQEKNIETKWNTNKIENLILSLLKEKK